MTDPSAAGAAAAAAYTNPWRTLSLPGSHEGLEEPAAAVLDRLGAHEPIHLCVHKGPHPLW
ncbi:MAG TPA: hypothetical protein VEF89_03175 [Solirubrobacteraceae bacterium]|nr:hypothetical protein [Solirubrobacteraceae bacterium]